MVTAGVTKYIKQCSPEETQRLDLHSMKPAEYGGYSSNRRRSILRYVPGKC